MTAPVKRTMKVTRGLTAKPGPDELAYRDGSKGRTCLTNAARERMQRCAPR